MCVGETALRRHLPTNRVSFDAKKQEKLPMAELMKQRSFPAEFPGQDLPENPPETALIPPEPAGAISSAVQLPVSVGTSPAIPSSSLSLPDCKLR